MPARDVDVRGIGWSGLAIGAAIVVAIATVFVLLHLWHVSPGADRLRMRYDLDVAGPTLQSAPQPELAAERASKARLLASSGWVDRAHGIVRIPIETAMRLLVEQRRAVAAASSQPVAASPTIAATRAASQAAASSAAPGGVR